VCSEYVSRNSFTAGEMKFSPPAVYLAFACAARMFRSGSWPASMCGFLERPLEAPAALVAPQKAAEPAEQRHT